MDIKTLRTTLEQNIAENNSDLVLESTLLDSQDIAELLNGFLPQSQLVIKNAQISETNTEIIINGQSTLFNQTAEVTTKFYLIEGDAHLIVTVFLAEDWTFTTSFPELANSAFQFSPLSDSTYIFDDLSLTDCQLILDSLGSAQGSPEEWEQGLNFQAKLDPQQSEALAAAKLFLGFNLLTLSGTIQLDRDIPQMYLRAKVTDNIKIGYFPEFSVQLNAISQYVEAQIGQPAFTESYFELVAQLNFDDSEQPLSIPISVRFAYQVSSLIFESDLRQLSIAGLSSLNQLVNGINLASIVPPQLQAESGLVFSQLSFAVNTNDKSLTSISLWIEQQEAWNILGSLELEGVKLNFSIINPTDSSIRSLALTAIGELQQWQIVPSVVELVTLWAQLQVINSPSEESTSETTWQGILSGTLRLGDNIDLTTNIFLPVGTENWTLASDNPIKLPSLNTLASLLGGANLQTLLPDNLGEIGSFTLETSQLEINPESSSLVQVIFVFSSSNDWSIINQKLVIKNLFINIEINQPTTEREVRGTVSGILRIGGVNITVFANYEGSSTGLQLQGSTGASQAIPIGDLITDIANKFGVDETIPSSIEELTIQNLDISFNTKTKDFTFTCESKFPVDGQEIDITVTIDITRQEDDSFNKQFGGYIVIGDLQFNLIFSKDNTSKTLVASYNNPNGDSLTIRTLVADVSDNIATYIPANLQITLQDALFAYSKNEAKTTFLFGLNLSSQINLSNLPLVGKQFPPEQIISVDDLQFLIASQNLNTEEADNFNNLIPDNITKIPLRTTEPDTTANNEITPAIKKGLNASANLQFANTTEVLALPISSDSQSTIAPSPTPETSITPTPVTDNTQWYPIKKTLGPLYFARIGIQYQDTILWFLLDASISSAGLTLTLDGLSVGSSIKKFKPQFNLQGIGIEYESKGAVSIGGALLRTTIDGRDEYSGSVIVETETFTISAIGAYTTTEKGHPSLFIYGILDKLIGGPPFFFVTGLALGFAYNRSLILPTLDQIPEFPLVKAALNGAKANPEGLITIQRELQPYIPPKVGQVMLAVGIKFTSFKIVDSFVLLVATFGDRFALDLIGISTLIFPPIPPGVDPNTLPPPLAQVRLAILARFVPSEGTLKVEGKILPDSYIFANDCQIVGGFAFYSWFSGKHQDDFVLTVGGYHPRFQIPAHYPRVDPLALNWRISNELTVKGSMYFALTASAIMAGGRLEAVWRSGSKKAWFIANAHFIVAWQPYFYEARIGVNLGASYTFYILGWRKTITVDVGANLHIWGPEFSGTASIDLSIISFTVRFGSRSQKKPKPINWSQFKESFLPAQDEVCTIAVESGLLRKIGEGQSEILIVNPKEFAFTSSSVIPIKTSNTEKGENKNSFGIAPMNVNSSQFAQSKYTITIDKESDKFTFEPIYKNVPTGLWGESNSNNPNRERFINNVLSGYKIKPANPPTPGETQAIERKNLAYDTQTVDNAYQWNNSFATFSASEETNEDTREKNIGESITSEAVKNARNSLLHSLGLSDSEIDLEEFETEKGIEQAFIVAPQLEEAII